MKDDGAAQLFDPGSLTPEDLEPKFRAVGRAGMRRGIRLERAFWGILKAMASANRTSISSLVGELANHRSDGTNLSSNIRVACVNWLSNQNSELARLASLQTTNAILGACPTPAFALSSSKKILTFNSPFQLLVRRQLPVSADLESRQDLRLALDMNVNDVFERLDTAGEKPVASGFVIGAGERRYRGQLNLVRAPVREPELLLAFVVNG